MFIKAHKQGSQWRLANAWGHELHLPGLPPHSRHTVPIGTLGTKFDAKINKRTGTRVEIVARMFAGLEQPVLVIDTRRQGVGGQGSWCPLEFATEVPSMLGSQRRYSFVHLPIVAPTPELLKAWREGRLSGWREFANRYDTELSDAAVAVARAFVEAAAVGGGLAVLLCAEPFEPRFDALPAAAQNACHCHRFNLIRRVAQAIQADRPAVTVERVDLDAAAFLAAEKENQGYSARVQAL